MKSYKLFVTLTKAQTADWNSLCVDTVKFNLYPGLGLCGTLNAFWKRLHTHTRNYIKWKHEPNEPFAFYASSKCVVHMHTCCHALALLFCREHLSVPQPGVGDIPDPKAKHRVGQQKLWHSCKTGLSFLQVLPQFHHIQNLASHNSK